MSEKKRLTLTGNKMPDHVYTKLEKLGTERTLTPYICSLIEKEEKMDSLIDNLSFLINKLNSVENIVIEIHQKLENTTIHTGSNESESIIIPVENIREGRLEISNHVEGGIEEEIEERDF
ncbi:hypothetical protein [Lysinibacillus fusiformis]|uniref:Uncharacterized protein n=1 Tax=Lysinibacillus fusiformis TaxID=28031 RepID=A0A1H9SH42_9BACI|nr:hypothetical protein [Lysinibacillus fusiformis]SCY83908.1 hypothetical protein SAMN02787081_04704 [Lysinibacillus fusiformis]SEO53803.1 hypothetical protein SAMN02787103_04677 [Lysinibacillus fusiformis]SER83703.1 hypothetical protein SAMN02787113_04709 [Lysinibacillus fusiformis]